MTDWDTSTSPRCTSDNANAGGEYDDAVRGLKKAENDTSLETEADGAPRKKKPPKRYTDYCDGDDEDKKNNTFPKKKKSKIRKLSTNDDKSESDTLPQVNSDVLNAVKENSIHMHQVKDKKKDKVSRRQSLENHVRVRVLQEFQGNSSQGSEQKQRQLKKVRGGLSQNISKKNEKQREMDHTKRKKFVSVTMPSKSHSATFLNSKTSKVSSSIKEKVTSSKPSEVPNTSISSSMSASDFVSGDAAPQDIQFLCPPSMQINNPDKGHSCSLVQTITSSARFDERRSSLKTSYSSSTSEANKNGTQSIFNKIGEEEAKSQEKSRSSFNFKDEGDYECKHCHSEIKMNSTVLLEVSKKLDLVLINEAIIIRSVNPDHAKSMIPSNIPSIPLKTKEDFQKMETFLANRINYEAMRDLLHSKCATALGALSVFSERSVTGNILSKLISNGLARLISWSGSEGDKIMFSDTKLCEVVFGAVKLRFPDSFLSEAEAKIKRWFQTANGRRVNETHDSDA